MVDPGLVVPLHVRSRIGLPVPPDGRAYPLTVRFGAEPAPLDQPGGYNYEISKDDRDVFERAVKDASSTDALRRVAALSALDRAFKTALGVTPFGVAYRVGSFLGKKLGLYLTQSSGSGFFRFVDSDGFVKAKGVISRFSATSMQLGLSASWEGKSGPLEVPIHGYVGVEDTTTGNDHANSGIGDAPGSGFVALPLQKGFGGSFGAGAVFRPFVRDHDLFNLPSPSGLGPKKYFGATFTPADLAAGPQVIEPPDSENLSGIEDVPSNEVPDFAVPKDELQKVIDNLKDSPWKRDYPNDPLNPTVPVTPVPPNPTVPIPDDPLDPNFPCDPPFPGGGQPPLPGAPPGPGGPGGPPLPGPGPGDIPGGPSPITNPTFPVPGPIDFELPECEPAMPGEPVTASLGGTTVRGKVGRYEPGTAGGDPCHFVVPTPPYADENFTKERCYRNRLAVEVAKEIAVELGMDPKTLVTEPGCTARFTGCFKKGSSKFDAMWAMLDLCGYGIFPDPTDPVIGPLRPLNVHHGPYHEDRDVFVFERSYDDLDMPSNVEYFRPNTATLRGFSVVVPVVSPYAVPFDKWDSNLAPASMTEAEALTAASLKAQEFAARGNVANVAVPLKLEIKQRHQVEVRRPLLGISFNYMVLSLSHDYEDDGDVTLIEARELGVRTYAPQPGGEGLSARGLGA